MHQRMNLPEDVIVEILSRLPVRALIKFKCICKSWNALLNDPTFISKHYRTISMRKDSELLLVSRRDSSKNERVISSLRNDGNDRFIDQELPSFLNDMFGHIRLIGPCRGVVCLYGFPDNIALWNPSVRNFKKLPKSTVSRPIDAKVRGGDVGLGFDSVTLDLKVVQILFCVGTSSNLMYQLEIYSSRTNTWRKHRNVLPANIMYSNLWSTVYRDETFCWWAQEYSDREVILSFDLRKELFEMTPLPLCVESLGGENRTTRSILPTKDSIALIVHHLRAVEKTFDVWILNELPGNEDSWIKVSSIGPVSSVERPLGFWDDDEFILESSRGELVMYNYMKREMKSLGVYGKRSRLEVLVYKESLFSVN